MGSNWLFFFDFGRLEVRETCYKTSILVAGPTNLNDPDAYISFVRVSPTLSLIRCTI